MIIVGKKLGIELFGAIRTDPMGSVFSIADLLH